MAVPVEDAVARFYDPLVNPPPPHVQVALGDGAAPEAHVLPLALAARLLEPGYLDLETGWCRHRDGSVHVAVLTRLPGVTAAMIDWWFGWYAAAPYRYRMWHPRDHVQAMVRGEAAPRAGGPEGYVGRSVYEWERIGGVDHALCLHYRSPETFGLDPALFADALVGTAVCAEVALADLPTDVGHLVHVVRDTGDGCEVRTRLWLGDLHVRLPPALDGGAVSSALDAMANRRAVRALLAPRTLGRDLVVHISEQMNHLGRFLPSLYHFVRARHTHGVSRRRAPAARI